MHRLSRTRRGFWNRFSLRCLFAVCLALFSLAYLSFLTTVMTAAGDWLVGVRTGNVIVKHMPRSSVGDDFDIVEFWPVDGGKVFDILRQSGGPYPPATTKFTFSLWWPLAILVVPTIIVWRRRSPRLKPNRCPRCEYDLTGNLSSRCPECGTHVPSPVALAVGNVRSGAGDRLQSQQRKRESPAPDE